MRIVLFYYDGFAEFEIAQACLILRGQRPIFAALERREYRSEEGQRFLPDALLRELAPETIDLFVIPGGDSSPLFENAELGSFLEAMLRAGKKIAGVCGGSELMAALGLLKGKRCTGNTTGVSESDPTFKYYEDALICAEEVVVDGQVITAQGQAFTEFAVTLADTLGLYASAIERAEELKWLRNIRE